MKPATFDQQNSVFRAPNDLDSSQCGQLDAFRGKIQGGTLDGCPIIVTAWELDDEDLAALPQGKKLFLCFVSDGLPPHRPAVSFEQATGAI